MTNKLFITEQEFKENAPLNIATNGNRIIIGIRKAQKYKIEPLIGSGLYNELQSQIVTGNVSVLNQTLLDEYIIPALIDYSVCEVLYTLRYKMNDSGINKMESENEKSISQEEFDMLHSKYANDAEYSAQRMIQYLKQNSASYPLYYNPGSGQDVIHAKSISYFSSLFLPDCDHNHGEYDEQLNKRKKY